MAFGSTNAGMTGIQFQNTSVQFTLQSSPDYADYPYRGQFANSGITAQAYADVVYSGTQASSGNYAPFCQTYDGGVYLYAKTNVGTQTIPTIAVGTASFSLTMDNGVTQGSQNPVTSGAVYNAITAKVDVLGQRTDSPSGDVSWSNITGAVLGRYDILYILSKWYNSSTAMNYCDSTPVYALVTLGITAEWLRNESDYWVRVWYDSTEDVLKTRTASNKVTYILGVRYRP